MTKYKLTLNKSDNTSKKIEFDIPDEQGNYELWFQKEDTGSVLAGNLSVGEKENYYQLKLGMSDGSELDAGFLMIPAIQTPTTVLTLYQETEITEDKYATYLHYICDGERPVVKFDGQQLTQYVDYPYADVSLNNNILTLPLPHPFPAGTHTITFEGGGPIYFGNYKGDEPMTTVLQQCVAVIADHEASSSMMACDMVTDVVFGTNYGDTIGAGAFRNANIKHFCLPTQIKRLGMESLSLGIMSYSDVHKTILIHNGIEYADTIIDPTLFSVSASVYFFYGKNDNVLFDPTKILAKGDNKATMTYSIYTDNSSIKNGMLSVKDEYTIVNMYHIDGSDWG